MNTINSRIVELIKSQKINTRTFSNNIGRSHQNISNIVKGKFYPSFSCIEDILKSYPDLNPKWLILGTGEMFNTKQKQEYENIKKSNEKLKERVAELEEIIKDYRIQLRR